jgi:two-component system, NtrC family, sensor histidine kinase HydH
MNTSETYVDNVDEQKVRERANVLFQERHDKLLRRGDKILSGLMVFQWGLGIGLALILSPYTWQGSMSSIHPHVYLAVFLGGLLSGVPLLIARLKPGTPLSRHVMAAAQMLWSALLIHLTGGRIETHFHVFVSLAFFSLYFDGWIYLTATLVVAVDHLFRGALIPESVYGIANPEWWRFLEHAAWVALEDVVLVLSCIHGVKDMKAAADQQARIEVLTESEHLKSLAIEMAMNELRSKSA